MNWNRKITRLLRNWHRDIGYFVVAVSLVYGLSGIFLTHKDVFPVFSTIETYSTFPSQLNISGFSEQWGYRYPGAELNKCFVKGSTIHFYFDGGKGKYILANGKVSIENYKKHRLTSFVNQLHLNQVKGWKYIANFFSLSLIFLAISGLFIVKGKKGFKKRGVWIMAAGFLLVLIYLFL